ncbi:MAG: rane-bound dehydrogenase domain protein [Verrucomicrobiaceae bacterium]|nr:rane-bound dehydrogenase domain protein [Verrucomicrobiaceae bacterium]
MKFFPTLLLLTLTIHAQESATRLVRTTEALTPAEEEKALHVPEGFEVHLFASEPMINKPINMAFDARGHLWVSSTVEYPYCADKSRWADPQGSSVKDSRDAIKILEDTDGDGKADKVTVFADGLNIPTGVLPWHKPEHKAGCIAWSIPNIWYFADTDGDGICDLREVLFGPLGYEKDTHGMCSSFRLGLDGWVYATHGFNNTSHLKAKDGSTLDLHSGNVFRFRPDGPHVEIWSWGQVNPFGLCWDRYNNLYSADCHSNPLTQLIRGAYYPSFGKPDDGLGHGPVMCKHSHGSTGLCGVLYIDGGVWGPEWDDHMILGNCVTSKVNHDKITFNGSTPTANEGADFITSDDPWFRAVDLQLGPDSALYVADFYNKIIGHYEVPLDHPGRDKERGRIWRITKKDTPLANTDFSKMDAKAMAAEMGSANLTRRRLALGEVKRRGTKEWIPEFMPLFHDWQKMKPVGDSAPAVARANQNLNAPHDAIEYAWFDSPNLKAAYTLWALSYLGERKRIAEVMRSLHTGGVWLHDEGDDKYGLVMSQATLIMGSYEELHPWEKWCLGIIFDGRGSDAGRAACNVLLNRPDFLRGDAEWQAFVFSFLADLCAKMTTPRGPERGSPWQNSGDVQYIHAMRILLRDLLSQPDVLSNLIAERKNGWDEAFMDEPWFLEIIRAVPTADAATYSFAHLKAGDTAAPATLQHLARNADEALLAKAITMARESAKQSAQAQIDAVTALNNGLMERGDKPPASLIAWASELAESLLAASAKADTQWIFLPHPGFPKSASPWCLQDRKCADGTMVKALSSLDPSQKSPEKLTGILRSKAFAAPAKLGFWLCGHEGTPKSEPNNKNQVRLVDAGGAVLQKAFPPRNDVCQKIEWDLGGLNGKPVSLEIVDGDDGSAYAWLGVTRIEPAVANAESFSSDNLRQKQLRSLATMLKLHAPLALRDKLRPYLPPSPATPVEVSPQERKRLDTLIAARIQAFAKAKPDAAEGAQVFTANCAVCHQLKGQGGLIGPQLDGIGNRGAERLMEDVLDPNKNVDANFQMHVIKLLDDSTISGFVRGELGQVTIVVDAAGQEHRVSKNEIKEDKATAMSLMPPLFGQTMPEKDLFDLVGYLLTGS